MGLDEAYSAAYLPPEEHRAGHREPEPGRGVGWIIYAGTVIAIAGAVSAIYGLAAISTSDSFDQGAEYMVGDLELWGWVVLILGVVQLAAGFGIWRGAQWARWLGVAAAALSAVAQLLWVQSQPLAALALYAANMLVIYGLLRYGSGRMSETT